MGDVFVHSTAMVETEVIGQGTRVWAMAHILAGASIGANCNIGDLVFIEGGAKVGDGVTVKNGAMLFDGVTVEDGAFIGPGVVFTNDRLPRSPRSAEAGHRYADNSWLEATTVERGATIGARAVITPGVTVGRFATVAAGAVVTHDVAMHALVAGIPARAVGWVCCCGLRLRDDQPAWSPSHCECGRTYAMTNEGPRFTRHGGG